jgi:hypothetical protein
LRTSEVPTNMETPKKIPVSPVVSDRVHGGQCAAAFTIVKPELVSGWAPAKLKVGLIGAGGRGRQAVIDAMRGDPAVELHSMGDIFEDKLEGNLNWLRAAGGEDGDGRTAFRSSRIPVSWAFDSYKKVLATDVDVVFLDGASRAGARSTLKRR